MHRNSFIHLLNSLFIPAGLSSGVNQAGQQAGGGQGQLGGGQQQQTTQNQRGGGGGGVTASGADFLKHHTIYLNTHCAILKILSSFSGSDYYELLNSIVSSAQNKPGYKQFLNNESEELNKAVITLVAHAIHLTCNRNISLPSPQKNSLIYFVFSNFFLVMVKLKIHHHLIKTKRKVFEV